MKINGTGITNANVIYQMRRLCNRMGKKKAEDGIATGWVNRKRLSGDVYLREGVNWPRSFPGGNRSSSDAFRQGLETAKPDGEGLKGRMEPGTYGFKSEAICVNGAGSRPH